MKSTNLFKFAPPRVCHARSTNSDPLVRNGLAITPKRMLDLTLEGKPISEQTATFNNDYIDGNYNCDFEPPHIYMRHADIISCYNASLDSKEQIHQVYDFVNASENKTS